MAIYTGSNKHLGGTENKTGKQQFYYGLVEKNILVTGGNGQLGREFFNLSQSTNSPFRFIFTDVEELDITHVEQVRDFVKHHAIRYIINCAAYTAVDNAENEMELSYRVNHLGAENLAKAATEFNCRMLHISTDYVFDGKTEMPYKEDDPVNPISTYGKSKLEGETAVLAYNPRAIIIRTQWLYSAYGKNFVKTMLRLMAKSSEINVVNDQHGSPTYAADLAEAILEILLESEKTEWKSGVYHFSNLGKTTWYGFAKKIESLSNLHENSIRPITTKDFPTLAMRPMYSILDKTKIQDTFHFTIPSWEESLKRHLGSIEKTSLQ